MAEKQEKNQKENRKLITEALRLLRVIVVAALLIVSCLYIRERLAREKEPELTTSFINGKLEQVSELTTSELIYTGLIKYSEGTIPFLTQNSFSMIYTAKVRAGIDVKDASVEIKEDRVVVTLPECRIQSVEVDPDSIEFYDEHFALFNWTKKEDVTASISAAKEDVENHADLDSLLESARKQTILLVENLLSDSIGTKELVIK